jgi:hypothetical protein
MTRLRTEQSCNRGSIPCRGVRIISLQSTHTGSEANKDSYSVDTDGFGFQGEQRPGLEADHSPPSAVQDKINGAVPPLTHRPEIDLC